MEFFHIKYGGEVFLEELSSVWFLLRDCEEVSSGRRSIFRMVTIKADSHITCRAHAVPLSCLVAKGSECLSRLVYTLRLCLIHIRHAML